MGAHLVQFLVALACGLWQSSAKTPLQLLKSGALRQEVLLFHFDTWHLGAEAHETTT
jgi:hypothetical protein